MGSETMYLVYSREHNAWWGPNKCGYFYKMEDAGRYTLAAATGICAHDHKRGYLPANDEGPSEFFVTAPGAASAVQECERLRAALQAWLDWYEELEHNTEPHDPLTTERWRVHGKRILQSRLALSPTPDEGGSPHAD